MWDLGDDRLYSRVMQIELPWAITYGSNDLVKRERIREAAALALGIARRESTEWAFRIFVSKGGVRPFDLDNVPKLIVDAFCDSQIVADRSRFPQVSLYPTDSVDHVVALQIAGERVAGEDRTIIEVFARRPAHRDQLMNTVDEAILAAMRALGGDRAIAEVVAWIDANATSSWEDIGTSMADLTYPPNRSTRYPVDRQFLERAESGVYRLRAGW